jgi:hypothetical protein
VPILGRKLTGNEGGSPLAAILDDLDEIAALGVAQGGEQPIVDGEELEPSQAGEDAGLGSVAAGHRELLQEAGQAHIGGGAVAAAAGPFPRRRRRDKTCR